MGLSKKEIELQKQINAMKKLGLTDDEIKEVIESDKAIEKGEKMDFDLTDEQLKEAKKLTKATSKKPPVYQLDNKNGKRSRKENATKAGIIAELAQFLQEKSENDCQNVEITNKERQIAFVIGENSYELTLVQKRKSKN